MGEQKLKGFKNIEALRIIRAQQQFYIHVIYAYLNDF